MKLIIDIPDKDYEKLKDGHIPFSILDVMQNGILLDKIRAEVADTFIKHGLGNTEICFDILQIIDRKGEQHDR